MHKTVLAGRHKWNPRRRWADNIEGSHREMGCEDGNWIEPSQDLAKRLISVNKAMKNLKIGARLDRRRKLGFSATTVHCSVIKCESRASVAGQLVRLSLYTAQFWRHFVHSVRGKCLALVDQRKNIFLYLVVQ